MSRPRIIYITDPLCGWCYAFGHALKEVMARFDDRCDFTLILGGMVTGDREGPIGAKGRHIVENAIPRLEQLTGVRMGDRHKAMLREGTQWQSSLLPSKAVVAVRELVPEKAIAFLHEVQLACFDRGEDLNDAALYTPLAAKLGVDTDLFDAFMADERLTAITEHDFAIVREWGIDGFPSLAAEVGTRFYGLAHGYRNADELAQLMEAVLRVDPTSA